ncbi:MAG TPA: response regulator [Bryobacteraceae bacterium]|nr:response regulator [Bryobacteraceae bacterium]
MSILLVEDNVADIHWLRLMMCEGEFPHRISVARDGEAALRALRAGERPDLIILDLNLPRVSGIEVLAAIRSADHCADIPLCVATGSELERDLVIQKYRLNVRCYLMKPITPAAFADALETYDTLRPWAELWRRLSR